jgi:DNA-binding Lrp family transcriptional regulator
MTTAAGAWDDTDRHFIALLHDDTRLSVVELARALGVARTTVQNRPNTESSLLLTTDKA